MLYTEENRSRGLGARFLMSCLNVIEISEMEKMLLHIVNFIFRLFLAILWHRKTIFMPMVVVKPHVTSTILFTTIMRLSHISQFEWFRWKIYEIWRYQRLFDYYQNFIKNDLPQLTVYGLKKGSWVVSSEVPPLPIMHHWVN